MPTRLVNKITGTERELPDRLAAMLIADKSSGWHRPPKRKMKRTDTDSADIGDDQETTTNGSN